MNQTQNKSERKFNKLWLLIGALLIIVLLSVIYISSNGEKNAIENDTVSVNNNDKKINEVAGDVEETKLYTLEEVGSNNSDESCWLIIDDLVFDVTEEAKLHPGAFHCGEDVSENYHKNHGSVIRDQMMEFYIGELEDDSTPVILDDPVKEELPIEPYRELYVVEGSWNVDELMVIVEKDAEKLLFIDGSTHTEVARIHDIGYQPHTSVYTSDGKYMFIIARNGWLTKIDLKTIEPIQSIKVGINSRGTALTDNGKFLAIGNYEPASIVIIDPVSMEVLKIIETKGEINGEQVESRVGGLIEDGGHIIAALKDLNSVWVINTDKEDFPVENKYWNIGGNTRPLHDAFLTPDGKYFITASMGSHTVWILDTSTWEVIKEVPTGETPHTGPGATWGDTIYIPALGEGVITAISTTTWEVVASIPTGGPGLFIRSYAKNPEYPYVWADTSFGEHHDEIYVIDARNNEIIKTLIPVEDKSSWHPEFTFDGKFVYVVSQGGNAIVIYDAYTFEFVKLIESNTPSAVSNIGLRIEEPGL